jgi:hypothetical protein
MMRPYTVKESNMLTNMMNTNADSGYANVNNLPHLFTTEDETEDVQNRATPVPAEMERQPFSDDRQGRPNMEL